MYQLTVHWLSLDNATINILFYSLKIPRPDVKIRGRADGLIEAGVVETGVL